MDGELQMDGELRVVETNALSKPVPREEASEPVLPPELPWKQRADISDYRQSDARRRELIAGILVVVIWFGIVLATGPTLNKCYFGVFDGGTTGNCDCRNEGKSWNLAATMASNASVVLSPIRAPTISRFCTSSDRVVLYIICITAVFFVGN